MGMRFNFSYDVGRIKLNLPPLSGIILMLWAVDHVGVIHRASSDLEDWARWGHSADHLITAGRDGPGGTPGLPETTQLIQVLTYPQPDLVAW